MSRRVHQGDDGIKWFEPVAPHFHKAILPPMLQSQNLGIPKKFIHKYGNLLSDQVSLKVPDGKTWRLDLDRSDEHENVVWISRGWSDFVKYYSIDSNFLVVFRYDGNSKFSVKIFDTSTLEIDYPCNSAGRKRPNVDADGEFFSPKIEEDDVYAESSPVALPSCKRMAANKMLKAEQPMMVNQEKKVLEPLRGGGNKMHPHCSKHYLAGKSGQFSNQSCKMPRMLCHATTESSLRARALEAASRFKSTSPAFHVVFSEVKMKYYLYLPKHFLENLEERRTKWVTLKVLNRSWRVKMWCRLWSANNEARFCGGWSAFRSQVPLHDGDVCTFQLVHEKDMLFRVSILRGDTLIR